VLPGVAVVVEVDRHRDGEAGNYGADTEGVREPGVEG
jgi:hypothetical protein